jgi:hypothetical protein
VYRSSWSARLQDRISKALTGKKRATWEAQLGYTVEELRCHLERQFSRGMSWENYAGNCPFGATPVWVIDHIAPKSKYHPGEAKAAFALTNLRPLWNDANMIKGARRLYLI